MKSNKTIENTLYKKIYSEELIKNKNNRNARLLYPYLREKDRIIASNFKLNCTILG